MSISIGSVKRKMWSTDDFGLVTPQRGKKRKSPEETLESTIAVNTLYDSHNTTWKDGVDLNSKIIDPHSTIIKQHKIQFHEWQKGYIDTIDSGKERFLSEACDEFTVLYHTYSDSNDDGVKNKLFNELFSNNLVKLVFKNPKILPQLEEKLDPLSYSTLIVILCDQASKNEEEFINVIKQNPSFFKEMSEASWNRIPEETRAHIQEIFVQRLVANPKDIQHMVQRNTTDLRNINNWLSYSCHMLYCLKQLSFPSMGAIADLGHTPEKMLVSLFNDIMKDEETFTKALQQVQTCAEYQKEIVGAMDLKDLGALTKDQEEFLENQLKQMSALEHNPKLFAKVNHLKMDDVAFPFYYLIAISIAKYVEKNPESTFKALQERLKLSEEDTMQELNHLIENLDITNQYSDQLRNVMYNVVMEPFLDSISPDFLHATDPYADYQIHAISNQEVLRPIVKEVVTRKPLLLNDFRDFGNDYEVVLAACIQQPELLQRIDGAMMTLAILQKLGEHIGYPNLTHSVISSYYAFLSDKVKNDTYFWKEVLHLSPQLIRYLPNEMKQSREKLLGLLIQLDDFTRLEVIQELQDNNEIVTMLRQLDIKK